MVQKKPEKIMSSRDKILAAIKLAQPELSVLPQVEPLNHQAADPLNTFSTVLKGIGGNIEILEQAADLLAAVKKRFPGPGRVVSNLQSNVLDGFAEQLDTSIEPISLEDTELAILPASFGVAENGSVWLSEEQMGIRVLPFICQHLAVVLPIGELLSNMHEAYNRLGLNISPFGAFIAGPSKTADIEQSLVLGAHGPKTMTVFLLKNE